MFCGECGTQNPDSNQFCKNCGKPLARRAPAGQPNVPSGTPAGTTPAAPPVPVPAYQPAPAPAPAYQQPVTPPAAVAPKRQWNWLGIVSLLFGLLSLALMPVIFAGIAFILGAVGLVLFKKSTGRIGISSITGIVLAIVAIVMVAAF